MKLWEIHDAIEKILSATAETYGELSEEQEKQLNELDLAQQEKILHCALYMQGEETEARAVEAMAQKLKERAKRHWARAEWILGYMERHSPPDPKFRIRDARVEVKWRKTERVEPSALGEGFLEHIDPEYIRTKVERVIDKAKARPVLKAGQPIRGLQLVEHTALSVSPRVKLEEEK